MQPAAAAALLNQPTAASTTAAASALQCRAVLAARGFELPVSPPKFKQPPPPKGKGGRRGRAPVSAEAALRQLSAWQALRRRCAARWGGLQHRPSRDAAPQVAITATSSTLPPAAQALVSAEEGAGGQQQQGGGRRGAQVAAESRAHWLQ